jgi:hypothetical protein
VAPCIRGGVYTYFPIWDRGWGAVARGGGGGSSVWWGQRGGGGEDGGGEEEEGGLGLGESRTSGQEVCYVPDWRACGALVVALRVASCC